MGRFVVVASAVLQLVRAGGQVATGHKLLAPTSMKSSFALVVLGAFMANADAAPASGKRTNLAFVLLGGPTMPRGEDIVRAYAKFASKNERIRLVDAKTKDKADASQAIALEFAPGGLAMVALMPVPVPNDEADDAARFSISTFGTGWKLPAHAAHLIVTLIDPSGSKPVDSLSRFTSVLAAVTEASHAVGVYWGSASATHDPKFVIAIASEQSSVSRIMLWTGVSMAREASGRISLLSLGMKQLELPDLLLTAPQGSANEALGAFFDLLAYVIDRGKPLPEGDAVGRSESERLRVHYVPSPIDATKKVWRVEMK